jgi:hypothetical protein
MTTELISNELRILWEQMQRLTEPHKLRPQHKQERLYRCLSSLIEDKNNTGMMQTTSFYAAERDENFQEEDKFRNNYFLTYYY